MARDVNAITIEIGSFRTGASSAKTIRVTMYDEVPRSVASLVAKIDSADAIENELTRYRNHVAPLLAVGSLVHQAFDKRMFFDRAALFYRLAANYSSNLFEVTLDRRTSVPAIIQRLENTENAWTGTVAFDELEIREVRRRLINDNEFASFQDALVPHWDSAERELIRFLRVVQHSDLHGENVRVAPDDEAVMIDYARVGMLPGPIGPVALELSFVFHPGSKVSETGWPNLAQASAWCEVKKYVEDSPTPEIVRACRAWANRMTISTGHRSVYATAYIYAVWQMKFASTDRAIAAAIANAALERSLDKM